MLSTFFKRTMWFVICLLTLTLLAISLYFEFISVPSAAIIGLIVVIGALIILIIDITSGFNGRFL